MTVHALQSQQNQINVHFKNKVLEKLFYSWFQSHVSTGLLGVVGFFHKELLRWNKGLHFCYSKAFSNIRTCCFMR